MMLGLAPQGLRRVGARPAYRARVEFAIRAGHPSDIDAAVAVWKAANTARRGGVNVPPEHESRVRRYLRKPDTFLAVAAADTGVVGMAVGMQALDDDGAGPPLPGLCHISAVFVHPGSWGRGVGAQLVRQVLAEGRARGYETFQLWTHADNARAQRLYEGLGFVRSGREKNDDFGERIVHYTHSGSPLAMPASES